MKRCKDILSIVASLLTIVVAVATVAGMFIGVTHIIETQNIINTYTTTQQLKKDTVTVVIRDTVVVEKPALNGNAAVNKFIEEQRKEVEEWKAQQKQARERWEAEQKQALDNFRNSR
jgi:biopolymer transport protein ExbB/TolQ